MPALCPIPPDIFKALLENYGFLVEKESEHNWTFFKDDAPQPVIILPKKGELLSVDVMTGILNQLKINNKEYFELLDSIKN